MAGIARLQFNGKYLHGHSIFEGGGHMDIEGSRAISAVTHIAGRMATSMRGDRKSGNVIGIED